MSDWKVPPTVFDSLYRYYRHGIPTGGFLSAVISNDAWMAAAQADPTNRLFLADIVLFNGQARRYHNDCKATDKWDGYEVRWESWRIRYSPEATAVDAGGEDEDE